MEPFGIYIDYKRDNKNEILIGEVSSYKVLSLGHHKIILQLLYWQNLSSYDDVIIKVTGF